MFGFKDSKVRLALLLRTNIGSDFKLKPILSCHFGISRALKNYVKSTLPMLYKFNNKAWMTADYLQHGLLNHPADKTYYSEKKNALKILLLIDNVPDHSRALMEMDNESHIVFMPVNIMPILQLMDQGAVFTFKSCYLRNFIKL